MLLSSNLKGADLLITQVCTDSKNIERFLSYGRRSSHVIINKQIIQRLQKPTLKKKLKMGSSSFFKVEIMLLSTAFSNKYRIKHVPRPDGRYGRGIDECQCVIPIIISSIPNNIIVIS